VLQLYLQEKMMTTFKFKQSVPGYNGFSLWVLKSDIYSWRWFQCKTRYRQVRVGMAG